MLDKLKLMLEFAALVEQCQMRGLITPEERNQYDQTLNGKVHSEIEQLLEKVEPGDPPPE